MKRRVETLISIWFIAHFAEQVFADGVLPTRQSALDPVEPANPWALDLDLATVKADLALGPPPAVRLASLTPLVALATGRCRILLQHLAQRLEPGGKAKKRSKLADMLASASAFNAYVGIAVDVVGVKTRKCTDCPACINKP